MRHVQRGISALFLVISILAIAVVSAVGYFTFSQNLKEKVASINSFEDCAKHYPVMESYPEQCNTPDGKYFTRELIDEERLNFQQQSIIPESAKRCLNKGKGSKVDPYITRFINSGGKDISAGPSNIKLKEDKILVDVITAKEGDLENSGLIEEGSTFGTINEGFIKLENLCKLADMPEVTYIQIPASPVPL